MAWVTTIGPDLAQVEYRLDEHAGCSLAADDRQVAYRLEEERPPEWVGEGLREFGIAPGTMLDEAGKDAARALMDGLDPRTGQRLVAAKMAVDPRGKLPAVPFAVAMSEWFAARDVTAEEVFACDGWALGRWARLKRGVARHGEAHRVPVGGTWSGSPPRPAGLAWSRCTAIASWPMRVGTPARGCGSVTVATT